MNQKEDFKHQVNSSTNLTTKNDDEFIYLSEKALVDSLEDFHLSNNNNQGQQIVSSRKRKRELFENSLNSPCISETKDGE
jgi:hypothetical protein